MGVHIFAPHSQTSKDPEATTHHDRRHLFRQLAELAFHLLHLISAIVVLAISVYFIYEYRRGAFAAPFWAALAIMDILICLYALFRTLFRHLAGGVAPAMFTLAGLWLTALVLALKDYFDSTCRYSSPSRFDECSIRSAHIAFSLLAFLTNIITMIMEIVRWRHNRLSTLVDDKASQTSGPVTATTTPFPVQTTTSARRASMPQNTPFPAQTISLPPQNTPFPA